jgi:hypothetical protein
VMQRISRTCLLLVLCSPVLLGAAPARAEQTGATAGAALAGTDTAFPGTETMIQEDATSADDIQIARPITTQQKLIRYATLIGFPLVVTVYGQQTWDWGNQRSFQFGKEGWFGYDTGLGGADKIGHAWACYALMRGSHAIFDYTENGSSRALWYAAAVAALIGTGIEVGDAFNGKYGFSWEDLIADYTGIGLALLMETVPTVDALLGFSAFYWPTRAYLDYPDKTILNLEGDTSGWTYMLNLKPAGLDHLGWEVPVYLRYLMLDLGYFTRGFTLFDRAAGVMDKSRSWFVGVSLNVPEVVDTLFGHRDSRARRTLRGVFEYYHLPIGVTLDSSID